MRCEDLPHIGQLRAKKISFILISMQSDFDFLLLKNDLIFTKWKLLKLQNSTWHCKSKHFLVLKVIGKLDKPPFKIKPNQMIILWIIYLFFVFSLEHSCLGDLTSETTNQHKLKREGFFIECHDHFDAPQIKSLILKSRITKTNINANQSIPKFAALKTKLWSYKMKVRIRWKILNVFPWLDLILR